MAGSCVGLQGEKVSRCVQSTVSQPSISLKLLLLLQPSDSSPARISPRSVTRRHETALT